MKTACPLSKWLMLTIGLAHPTWPVIIAIMHQRMLCTLVQTILSHKEDRLPLKAMQNMTIFTFSRMFSNALMIISSLFTLTVEHISIRVKSLDIKQCVQPRLCFDRGFSWRPGSEVSSIQCIAVYSSLCRDEVGK